MVVQLHRITWASALALAAAGVHAAEPQASTGYVSLSSSATIEVTKDLLTVAMGTTREGADAATVQTQLKRALEAALAEAKKVARPGQLDVQTGNFSISPRYNSTKGTVSGWQGSTELLIEGRDMEAIGQLTGRIATLTISRVGYAMSRELREKAEGDLAAQAIGRYRAKAADYAKSFGYTGYTIREVNVSTTDASPGRPFEVSMARSMTASADVALPVEPGKGTLGVTVAGSIQMTR